MEDTAFDQALVAAAFEQASLTGWRGLSIVDAARAADLPLDRARARCPGPAAVLMRFGLMADQMALAQPLTEPLPRDNLFDLLMHRFDVLQQHRAGMLALLRYLPTDPALALALSAATARSMGWMLEAAGVPAAGLTGRLRVAGLVGVWLYALRAWKDDESADLASTMSALDKALDQAEKISGSLPGGGKLAEPPAEFPAGPDDETAAALVEANPAPPPPPEPPPSPEPSGV
jgi:ubiquinone biosynthesis protein COQ9